ncbi:hypothetical protein JOF56_010418 [Kibdelosporangium banguiense]|uniref:NB-ARC domain-containing protein n=1 Tax=Kibdelosporangium banguiense TaxID=1365924 RepID=A0ABS4U051_9PSEU|nr:tetratricopeptide repeat protein [Kibdelosporangium banguiense]MBP2330033.1 hypothetical protein [Kibdelosporangium banguiense]
MSADVAREWFRTELDRLRRQSGSPSIRDLVASTRKKSKYWSVLNNLTDKAGLPPPKELSRSTLHDLLSCKTVKGPAAWPVKMFVLACVAWRQYHGGPKPPRHALLALLAEWEQRRVIYEDLLLVAATTEGAGSPVRIGWPLPMTADPLQERDIVVELDKATRCAGAIELTQRTLVLEGTGGVGKTQLAADFARRIAGDQEIRLVLWASAGSRDTVLSAYAAAAFELGLADADAPLADAAQQLQAWLARGCERWVVVLDDVQNPADLQGLWPEPGSAGRVVVTTRYRDESWNRTDRGVITVDVFTPDESAAYLAHKFARSPELGDGAAELAAALGHLPIALAQATAYQLSRRLSGHQYLDRLTDQRRTLRDVLPGPAELLPDDQPYTVAEIWSLSIELADTLTPPGLARPLLAVASLLDPTGIPDSVLRNAQVARYLGQRVDSDAVHEALWVLHRLNLVTVDGLMVRMHALVHRTTREAARTELTAPEAWHQLVHAAADGIAAAGNDRINSTNRDLLNSLRQNAQVLIGHGGDALWTPDGHVVLFGVGEMLLRFSHAGDAAAYFKILADTACERLGATHVDTYLARARYATCLEETGQPKLAVAEMEQIVADCGRTLGIENPTTLNHMGNLAGHRGRADDIAGAVRDYEHLVGLRTRIQGANHRNTLMSRSNLARWRGEAGDIPGAIQAFSELVPLVARVCGPLDHQTLITLSNHASWVGELDPLAGLAEYLQLLPKQMTRLGAASERTLTTRRNIAMLLGEAGYLTEAIREFTLLIADYGRFLHPDRLEALAARHDLATLLIDVPDVPGALRILRELLADRTRILGAGHPATAATREMIENTLRDNPE